MRPDVLAALTALYLLTACSSTGGGRAEGVAVPVAKPAPRTIAVRSPARRAPPPAAHVQALPGLESVIGATAGDLARQFGAARLDVWEGDARKLQYGGAACLLDIYLYPAALGREPQATYVDARRASDGKEVDRLACIAALRKR